MHLNGTSSTQFLQMPAMSTNILFLLQLHYVMQGPSEQKQQQQPFYDYNWYIHACGHHS